MVGTTGAKVKNKINDLCTLTGHSGALIANGNFQRRPPHPRVRVGCQLPRKLPCLVDREESGFQAGGITSAAKIGSERLRSKRLSRRIRRPKL